MADKTILIVDDSKVSRMMISALIKDLDGSLTLTEADGGEQALEVSKTTNIDYFSVDLNMQGMNGLELIEKLIVLYPDAKYSLLTANVQDATRIECEKLGIKFTEKPVTETCIKEMLEYFNA